MVNQIVVAGAIIAESKVLIAQRIRPPELAGRWELPGGKVAAGETEPRRWPANSPRNSVSTSRSARGWATTLRLTPTTTLRAYEATLIRGEPHPHDHAALRWVSAAELDDVDWVPADRAFCRALGRLLVRT